MPIFYNQWAYCAVCCRLPALIVSSFFVAISLPSFKLFDSIDKDGSGYVEEREWRRLTRDTPLAASDDTVLLLERVSLASLMLMFDTVLSLERIGYVAYVILPSSLLDRVASVAYVTQSSHSTITALVGCVAYVDG